MVLAGGWAVELAVGSLPTPPEPWRPVSPPERPALPLTPPSTHHGKIASPPKPGSADAPERGHMAAVGAAAAADDAQRSGRLPQRRRADAASRPGSP